jgi:EAL domain-containing protein (putative c-di-GMP-specific phosphodiesterase class I)
VGGVDGVLEPLLRDADAAMYRAKERTRGGIELFDSEMRRRTLARLETEAALRRALERSELTLRFQPQVDMRSGAVLGVEALVRWRRPGRGRLTMPAEFIKTAEESGLIVPLGEWVLREACNQMAVWTAGGYPVPVCVNVSPRQMADPAFPSTLEGILADTGCCPANLTLEVTEGVFMEEDALIAQNIVALRRLGVQFAIDDFGTGYSSLVYLKRLPVEMLKIDMSFVHGVGLETGDDAIVRAVASLASDMGIVAVAEGVEHRHQVGRLLELGCRFAQGFYFARPLTATATHRWFKARPLIAPESRSDTPVLRASA